MEQALQTRHQQGQHAKRALSDACCVPGLLRGCAQGYAMCSTPDWTVETLAKCLYVHIHQ